MILLQPARVIFLFYFLTNILPSVKRKKKNVPQKSDLSVNNTRCGRMTKRELARKERVMHNVPDSVRTGPH